MPVMVFFFFLFQLLCHGGMAGNKFFADLHVLQDGQWTLVDEGTAPSARAGHGAVAHGNFVYIFGGLGPHGSLDDLWKLDCSKYPLDPISQVRPITLFLKPKLKTLMLKPPYFCLLSTAFTKLIPLSFLKICL